MAAKRATKKRNKGQPTKPGQAVAHDDHRAFQHVSCRVFSHATEDPAKVVEALARVEGVDLDDEAAEARFAEDLHEMRSVGHFNNAILILTHELRRNRDVRAFWDHVLADDAVRTRIANETDDRLDEDNTLWLRFDKQAAYQGRLRLTHGEDVIQVRAKVATFPKDRATALAFLGRFLSAEPTPAGRDIDDDADAYTDADADTDASTDTDAEE